MDETLCGERKTPGGIYGSEPLISVRRQYCICMVQINAELNIAFTVIECGAKAPRTSQLIKPENSPNIQFEAMP